MQDIYDDGTMRLESTPSNEELKNEILLLQKGLETLIIQHSELNTIVQLEKRKLRKLESEMIKHILKEGV